MAWTDPFDGDTWLYYLSLHNFCCVRLMMLGFWKKIKVFFMKKCCWFYLLHIWKSLSSSHFHISTLTSGFLFCCHSGVIYACWSKYTWWNHSISFFGWNKHLYVSLSFFFFFFLQIILWNKSQSNNTGAVFGWGSYFYKWLCQLPFVPILTLKCSVLCEYQYV